MDERIRVLHMITRLIVGGAQQNTAYTSTHLDRDKYEVEVLVGPSIEKGGGELITGIRESRIIVHDLPVLTTPIHPFKDIAALWKSYRFLKKNRFDIIHTHSSKAGILGRLAAKWAGVPIIVHTVHGWGFTDRGSKLKKNIFVALEKLVSSSTTQFIAVTRLDIDKGEKENIAPKEKFVVIRSGIDIPKFSNVSLDKAKKKESLGISSDADVVCMVGRLSDQKAPDDFVRVAEKVISKRSKNTVFLLVGDGPLRPMIESMISQKNLSKNILLTGLRSDVHEILQIIDIFLLTSLWEGLPRVFPQAMAAGKPIVATHVDGAPEAIEDGVTGFLAEPHDVNTLTEKVCYLLENKDVALKMGEEASRRVYPEFSDKEMVRKIDELYQILLQKRAGR